MNGKHADTSRPQEKILSEANEISHSRRSLTQHLPTDIKAKNNSIR